MTANYIKSKIENKAKTISDVSCFIIYCEKTFSQYFTLKEILEIINNVTIQRSKKTYKSPFLLSN